MEALLVAGVPALVGPALLFLLCPLGNHHHTDIVPKVLHGVGGDDEDDNEDGDDGHVWICFNFGSQKNIKHKKA